MKVMDKEIRFCQKVTESKIMFTSTNFSCAEVGGSERAQTCSLPNKNLEVLSSELPTSTASTQGTSFGLYI